MLTRGPAERLVLDNQLGEFAKLHSLGIDLSYCLEYAVSLGRHRVTQYLLDLGTPVTRFALYKAAARHGTGMDLLLAALNGADLARAQTVALGCHMVAGAFKKAYRMLEAGVDPDREFVSHALTGTQRRGRNWQLAFQEALDKALPNFQREALDASDLRPLIEFGRPIHIERTLEILQCPATTLLPRLMGGPTDTALRALRAFGAAIDDEVFAHCAQQMTWSHGEPFVRYLHQLCHCAICDGQEGAIRVKSAAPLIRTMLEKRGGQLAEDLRCLMPCLRPSEHHELHSLVDDWGTTGASKEDCKAAHQEIDRLATEFFVETPGPSP